MVQRRYAARWGLIMIFNKSTVDGRTVAILEYSSVYDARESQKTMDREYNRTRANNTVNGNRGAQWYGIEGGAPAVLSMLENGYPEGAGMVTSFRDALGASVGRAEGIRRRRVRGPMGDTMDVHAVNRGQLDRAWSSTLKSIRKGSGIIRILVDIGGNAGANANSLRWRGVAALTMCEILIKAGYSVEIVAGLAVHRFVREWKTSGAVTVVVKPRNVFPDYDLLAATVCLPGFFRTIGFCGIVQMADKLEKDVDSGLGGYADITEILPVQEKITQLVVNGSVSSKKEAEEFCNASIKLLQR